MSVYSLNKDTIPLFYHKSSFIFIVRNKAQIFMSVFKGCKKDTRVVSPERRYFLTFGHAQCINLFYC